MRSAHHLTNSIGSLLVPVGALAVAPLVARSLGSVDRGYFANDQALMIVVSAAFAIGLSDAVAVNWLQWSQKSRRRVVWLNLTVAVILTASAVAYMVAVPSRGLKFYLLSIFVLGCFATTAANFARGVSLAHSDILGVGLDKIIVSIGRLVLTAILFATDTLTLETALVALALPQLASWIVLHTRSTKLQLKHEDITPQQKFSAVSYRNILLVVVGGLGGVLLVNLSQVFFLPLIGPASLGYLAVALIVAELFTALAKPFRDAIFAADERSLPALSKKVLLTCAGVSLSAGVAGYFLMEWGVIFFFGQDFAPAVPAAKVLLLGGILKGISYIVNGILIVQGHALSRIYSTYAGVVVLVGVALALADYGAIGASVSLTAAYGVMLVIGLFAMRWSNAKIESSTTEEAAIKVIASN